MKRKQWSKVVATVTAAAMALGGLVTNPDALMQVQAETGNYTYVDDAALDAALGSDGVAPTFTRWGVHDPSIVKDGDTYYVFGSHMGTAKTKDLRNWEGVVKVENDATSNLFGTVSDGNVTVASFENAFRKNAYTGTVKNINGAEVDFGTYDAAAWNTDPDIKDNDGKTYGVSGNMWAPDVIYNAKMGKWCMYLSLNGAKWNSCVILLTADDIEGPYVYQGPIVYSGFNGTNALDISSTDLSLIYPDIATTGLPAKYTTYTAPGVKDWGEVWPHAIDPCVSYDEDGELYLIYGSWSGGIYALELDENTGLRDYTVTYTDDYNADKPMEVTSDAYFGKKIAGGAYVSGEGAYVEKIGDYWYLFMSYGFYSPEGGYEMRIFRSENIDGPYVDASGDSAIYPSYKMNYGVNGVTNGEKLMGGYQWESMDHGELAQGHNSAFTDDNGNAYVVYHTKFNDRGAAHELRVHQLYVNKDGWLVAAPYEYTGETVNNSTLAATTFETAQIAGDYQIIVHKYGMDYANKEIVDLENITLLADGTVDGDYVGTWEVSEGSYVTITLAGTTYEGVLVEQTIDGTADRTLCFTARSNGGVSLWGSRILGDEYALAMTREELGLKDVNKVFPIGGDIYYDVELPTTGSQGAVVSWESSKEDVLSATGEVNVPDTDTQVTMTCTVVKGTLAYEKSYEVTVKGKDSRVGNIEDGLIAKFEFDGDFVDSVKGIVADAVAQGSASKPSIVTDKELGDEVVKVNAGADADNNCTYLAIPNPLKGSTTGEGTVSLLVRLKTKDLWKPIWGFMSDEDTDGTDGTDKFFLTANPFLGYNGPGGFFDANNASTVVNAIPYDEWSLVTVAFDNDGFDIYIDGAIAFNQDYTDAFNSGRDFSSYESVMELVTSVDTFYLNYGTYWGSNSYRADDLRIYDRVLDGAAVATLYEELLEKLENAADSGDEPGETPDSEILTGRQYAEIEQKRTYYNDFEDGYGDAVVYGNGALKTVEDKAFGQVYQNATADIGVRKNFLVLPEDTISNAAQNAADGMTIGFWVNAGDAKIADYKYAPIFSAYDKLEADASVDNKWPMMVLQSRLLAQVNCGGWTDLGPEMNVNGTNLESNEWLGDGAWHYYAASFSDELVTVYVDGEVMNQWEVDGSEGKSVNGLFTNGSELKYVCLGGNQAWTFQDADAPYMYDRVSLFSIALTSDEVKTVMAEEGKDRTIDEIVSTRTYYNDFENGLGTGVTQVGAGQIEIAKDADFGNVYHNATANVGIRTNYLLLPEDTIANAALDATQGMSIGFWVNAGDAKLSDFFYAPLFSAYEKAPNPTNTSPMMILQSRLIAQVNNAGWTDFTDAENVAGINSIYNSWLGNNEWHYYTATFTEELVTVYVDGKVMNQWEVDGSEGKTVNGLFDNASALKYVCLGGNQAWDWGDVDAPYLYDEVSLFSTALTQGEIEKIMAQTKEPEVVVAAKDRDFNELESYKTYFIDFEDGYEDTKVVGTGAIETAKNTSFGKVYHNATGELGIRSNYLQLPNDVIANAIVDEEMSIGFWVNVANAKDYMYTPIFTAYKEAPSETEGNTYPMMALQSRLLAQVNCGGWSDFKPEENVVGSNLESTVWLDDMKWHYYTATFTEDSVAIFVDGVLQNEWSMSLNNGNRVKGLLYDGGTLKYVCLGGNQAWKNQDVDSQYMFDDVAVYSTALTAGEIGEIIKAKNVTDITITEQPEPSPSPSTDPSPSPSTDPSPSPSTDPSPVPSAEPSSAPSAGPGATEAPTATPSETEAPVVTDTPAPTAEPGATPVPEVSMSTLIQETNVVMNKLAEAESAEEVAEIIDEYIDNVVGAWAGAETLTNEELSILAQIEETIEEAMKEICGKKVEVDVQLIENCTFAAHDIENALLTVPTGGHLVVSLATLASGRQELASKLGVTAEQLAGAEVFDLHLVDDAGNAVPLNAPVRVHFNIPERMLGKQLKMLHFLDNNGAELLDVTVDGNQGSFITESFSEFALVAVGDIANDNNNDSQENEDSVVDTIIGAMSPKTGDLGQNSIAPWVQLVLLGIMFVAAAITGSAILRKKEEE